MKLHDMRRQYERHGLDEQIMPEDPLSLFGLWFEEAVAAHAHEANAVVLATLSGSRPSARVVLLKEISEGGFVFYTNYESRKGKELKSNPFAAMLFYWPELERQVRIEGSVVRISREASEEYFNSRPERSRLSAIISPQSQPVGSREALEHAAEQFLQSGRPLHMPDYWGGYKLIPDKLEFWQGRPDRLHDRVLYELVYDSKWQRTRLAP